MSFRPGWPPEASSPAGARAGRSRAAALRQRRASVEDLPAARAREVSQPPGDKAAHNRKARPVARKAVREPRLPDKSRAVSRHRSGEGPAETARPIRPPPFRPARKAIQPTQVPRRIRLKRAGPQGRQPRQTLIGAAPQVRFKVWKAMC